MKTLQALFQNALHAHQIGDLAQAKMLYEQILTRTHSPEVLNNLGAIFLTQGDVNTAIDFFNKALQAEPKHKDARSNLATILLQQDRFSEAIWHYQLFLQLAPEDSDAYYNLGVAYMASGDLTAAIDLFKRTLQLIPRHVDAYCNLGAIYLKMSDRAQALAYYQEAAKLQPDNPAIRYRIAALTGENAPSTAPIEYIKNLFDNYAGYFDQQLTKELHYQLPTLLRQLLQTYLPAREKWRILDLGCGTGLSGAALRDIANHLTGVDISSRMLAKAHEKNLYDKLIEDDINHFLAHAIEDYALIVAADTLVYFGDLTTIFANCRRLLEKNGLLVFSIEVGTVSPYQLQATGRYNHAPYYIEQLAQQHGFAVLDYREVTGRLQQGEAVVSGIFILKILS